MPAGPGLTAPPESFNPEAVFSTLDPVGRRRIAVAVSGGGDSMALLAAAHRWTCGRGDITLLAVTIDHALRPDSAAEAAQVAAFCSARGIVHRTLVWSGEKPAAGISATARQARHSLLAQAAREAGTDIVLTGHTLDDQAETVTMRGERGGGRGEAGIAPATLFDNAVWFVRPLLDTRRETLREFLRDQGIGWAEDPSNIDMRYERARLRKMLDEAARQTAVGRAAEQGRAREDAGRRAAALIDAEVSRAAPGLFRLGSRFVEAERDVAIYALRILLAVVGGRFQLVETNRAAALLSRLVGSQRLRATLSRCVVDRRGDSIFLYREARDLPEIPLGDKAVAWDGRYLIVGEGEDDDRGLIVGQTGHILSDAAAADPSAPSALVRAANRTEPHVGTLSEATEDASSGIACIPLMAPWARYLPSFDLAPARAVSRLVGGREIPLPPLARHNRVT